MTIVRQLNLLFIAAAVVICLAMTLIAAQREYRIALDSVQQRAETLVTGRPALQYSLYSEDEAALQGALADFLSIESVSAGAAFNTGALITAAPSRGAITTFPIAMLRRGVDTTGTGVASFDEAQQAGSTGFWPMLFGNREPIYLTLPVFTATNPTQKGLAAEDFARALVASDGNGSRVVIGYIGVEVSRTGLMAQTTSRAGSVLLIVTILLAGFLVLLQIFLKRAMQSISRLKTISMALASGEAADAADIERAGEFSEIARALNKFVKDARNLNQEMSMEKNLFRLQAEHSASELSAKDEELTKIADQVTESREQIRKLASYDRITDLPNRGLFLEHVNRLLRLADRDETHTALLCLSLVNFERIQESMGRNFGDLMLKEVAKRLVGSLRASDMLGHYVDSHQSINVSRLSGDEFAVVLNRLTSSDHAGDIAQRVAEAISRAVKIDGRELFPNPAIGIAVAPRDGNEAELLLKHASAAKHHAAASSTTNHLFYTDQMDTGDGEEFKLAPAIRKAMAANEFNIHYQPQINTTYGSITSAEAFLRWEHPEYGQVSPFKFVPIAEESGLIVELGNWVLTEACRQLKEFREQGLELPRVALNISPQQLSQEFPNQVRDALKEFELEGSSLELGLSEDILARDDGRALYILLELKAMGVHLSLENFGTTPSSFVYISRYPLDDIKIERGFVADCHQREDTHRLVDAVISMANSLGLEAVAEGVETEGEYRHLINHGVRTMRGYLFSRPIPAEELREQVGAPWHFMKKIQALDEPVT